MLISAVMRGYRLVVVGQKIYHSQKWNTFEQFLIEYVKMTFGYEWGGHEAKKPVTEQHPVYLWHRKFCEAIQAANAVQRKGEIYLNVPGSKPFSDASHWLRETIENLKSYEEKTALPSALIVATNHPRHYAEDDIVGKHGDAMIGGFRRADLRIEDPEYCDLINAVNFLDEIPQFD